MASNASSLCFSFFFLILTLSFFHQTQARDSTLFSKFSRKPTTENTKETSPSSVESPAALTPESEPVVEEHGYGLYGRENYRYSPTTKDPVRTGHGVGEDKFVSLDEIRNEMRKKGMQGVGHEGEKQGMSDTRFLENGKYYYDINQDVKDENEKMGMSDTRFMENGRYHYDINQENDVRGNNYGGYESEKHGMNEHVEEENGYPEKKGMSDLENRRYHYDLDDEDVEKVNNGETYHKKSRRGGNGYVTEKQGMSDTRFMENGKYFYDINAEVAKGDQGFLNSKNEYENGSYNENEKYSEEGNNGYYETEERRGQNYNPNEYLAHETEGYHGRTKKLPPNQYDSMEEYEKEEEYRLSHQFNP